MRSHEVITIKKIAYLKSQDGMTALVIDGTEYLFPAPKGLLYYAEVRHWDGEYLVVTARYSHEDSLVEEYLDLKYMLDFMGYDASTFIGRIDAVEIHPDQCAVSDDEQIDRVAKVILENYRAAFEELAK